jgi:uridine phosphorylase
MDKMICLETSIELLRMFRNLGQQPISGLTQSSDLFYIA